MGALHTGTRLGVTLAALSLAPACSLLTSLDGLTSGTDAGPLDAAGDAPNDVLGDAPGDVVGCDANTSSDSRNCGTCGHDCLGAACNGGVCAQETIVANIPNPLCLTADAANVYWSDDNGVHQAANTNGSNPQTYTFSNNYAMTSCTVTPATLYAAHASGIMTWPTGQPTAAYGGVGFNMTQIQSFVIASAGAWITDPGQGALVCADCTQSGTNGFAVIVGGLHSPFGVAVSSDGASVFWTDTTDGTVSVVASSSAPDSGAPTVLATGQSAPRSLVADVTTLYWANQGGTIMSMSIDGGAATALAKAQADPEMIRSDLDTIYWLDVNSGSVMEVRKTGGTPLAIATQQTQLAGLAVAAGYVYWSVGGPSGEIRRAPK